MDNILTGTQSRYRDSYAFSPECGLVVRANGEEKVQVINSSGTVYPAGIKAPTVAPTIVSAGTGVLPISQYFVYVYVYAAKAQFPLVNASVAVNGSLAPRSNQSPSSTPFQISATIPGQNTVTVTCSPLTWIDTIWIFRTNAFATSIEATTAASAGDCYFLGEVPNIVGTGTTTYVDNLAGGTTLVELDNYVAPQFQYVTYYDPYYYGWGNNTFSAECSYATTGIVTLTGSDTWFDGRNGQFATIANITSGGIDGQGLFYFKWLTSTTAQLVDASGANLTLPVAATSTVSIQGPAATLYRSKIQNPMGWGDTENIAPTTSTSNDGLRIPSLTAMRVGGGYGTAIAVIPDQALLKLDAEFPASCYTFNLQLAGTANFVGTKKLVSNVFSVTSNDSQYSAVNTNGRMVLRGMDYKNYSIIECDGLTQLPVSTPIPLILRRLTKNRGRQLLTHGVYDPFTELNCMWVSTYDSASLINLLIYEHAPTGFWGIVEDYDVLCSSSIQDPYDGTTKTFLGTQSGFIGQGFVDGLFNNWLPLTGLMNGTMASATSNSFVRAGTTDFNVVDPGMVGNWCMITDPNGLHEQWGRIVSVTVDTIYFDIVKSYMGTSYTVFDPVPQDGWLFYIGMIDVRLLKYFDFNTPSTDKKIEEVWLTSKNHTNTSMRLYRERQGLPYATMQVTPNQLTPDASTSDAMFTRTKIPATLLKTVGLEVVDRSYSDWQLANMTVKATLEP